MKKRGWQVLFLTLAALLALALVLPVSAEAPVKSVWPYQWEYYLIPGTDSPCEFAIRVNDTGTVNVRQWFENGAVVREFDAYNRATTVWTGPNGVSLPVGVSGANHYRVVGQDAAGNLLVSKVSTGQSVMIVLPGVGPVFGAAGRVELVLTLTPDGLGLLGYQFIGQSGGSWSNTEALCEYLGG